MKKSEKNHASVRKFNKHFLLIFWRGMSIQTISPGHK